MNLDYVRHGLTDGNKGWRRDILVPICGTILAGSVLYACREFSLIEVNSGLSEIVPDVLGKYLLLVVAFERAAAVLVGMLRSQSRVDWSLRINRLTEILKKEDPPTRVLELAYARERQIVDKLTGDGVIMRISPVESNANDDYHGYLTTTKHAYEFQRARFNSVSNRYVARAVFVAGIVMATLGVSLFADVFKLSDGLGALHNGLLRAADIFVTGGLLGGGSAGLNATITKVDEFISRG